MNDDRDKCEQECSDAAPSCSQQEQPVDATPEHESESHVDCEREVYSDGEPEHRLTHESKPESEPEPEAGPEADVATDSCFANRRFACRPQSRRVLLVAAALVAVVLAAQTISFVVSSLDMQGHVFFGSVSVQVEETMLDASGAEVPVSPEAEQIDAVRAASRIVRVRNTGEEPVFVRVRLNMMGSQGGAGSTGQGSPANDLASYEVGTAWVERDGWCYLPGALEPGALSEPVITGIAFDQAEAQRRFPNGTVAFEATAQCVQVKHNATTSLDAEGWPNGDE